jgi:hypothetical protein
MSAFQESAEPLGASANLLDMDMTPSILRLLNAPTFKDGILEKWNKDGALGSDVALVFESSALSKVKTIASQSTNEDANTINNNFFSWRHGFL